MALLHALAGLRARQSISLSAVHVHHGLSPQADDWAAHCQSVCDALEIPLRVARVQVQLAGQGLEAAAREARYRAFSGLDVDALCLAQHQDDQAETVLLQLRRGASARGMAAMPVARQLHTHALLLRPLLGFTRAHLESYARFHGLSWVEDETNQDPSLARNHVRHTLLPTLDAAVPGMSESLAKAAYQFSEWADLLDDLADEDGAGHAKEAGLEVSAMTDLSEPRARNLLRRVLEQSGVDVRRRPLVEATRQLREACTNAQVRIDFGEVSVVRFQGRVQVVHQAAFALVPDWQMPWLGEGRLDLGPAGYLEFHQAEGLGVALHGEKVLVRHRRAGDRLRLRPGQMRRPLKDLLREGGLPPWQRPWLPVVEVDGQVAWVAGLGAAAEFSCQSAGTGWVISWVPPW
jgi:tRNA(Ile)-lysidine synthase